MSRNDSKWLEKRRSPAPSGAPWGPAPPAGRWDGGDFRPKVDSEVSSAWAATARTSTSQSSSAPTVRSGSTGLPSKPSRRSALRPARSRRCQARRRPVDTRLRVCRSSTSSLSRKWPGIGKRPGDPPRHPYLCPLGSTATSAFRHGSQRTSNGRSGLLSERARFRARKSRTSWSVVAQRKSPDSRGKDLRLTLSRIQGRPWRPRAATTTRLTT